MGEVLGFGTYEPVSAIHGKLYAVYRRWYKTAELPLIEYVAEMHVVQQIDGPAVFAIGGYEPELHACSTALGVGEYGVGLESDIPKTGELLAWAPWSHPATMQSLLTTRCSTCDVYEARIGADRMFIVNLAGMPYSAFSFGTQTMTMYKGASRQSVYPLPVPGGLLSLDYPGMYIRRDDNSEDLLIASPPLSSGRHISSFSFDRATNTIVWVEVDNSTYTNPVLWTAPLALFPQGIVRRRVTAYQDAWVGAGHYLVANRGMVILPNSNQSVLLVRLSDGWGWSIPSEPGKQTIMTLWVTDDEVAVGTTRVPWSAYQGPVYIDGILRIARNTLGPADIPPSL